MLEHYKTIQTMMTESVQNKVPIREQFPDWTLPFLEMFVN